MIIASPLVFWLWRRGFTLHTYPAKLGRFPYEVNIMVREMQGVLPSD